MPRLLALTVVATVTAVTTACQSYDLEPVNPRAIRTVHVVSEVTAQKAKPDLMLMVDRSLSMNLPVNPADARCPAGCGTFGNACPATCPTRWSELSAAMNDFLTQYGGVARMGLTPFAGVNPDKASDQCYPGSVTLDITQSNDVPSELQATAASINGQISALTPRSGTPTGPTLETLRSYPFLTNPDRDDYVLLLTDGLPNCNPDNANDYTVDPAACKCTTDVSACAQVGFTKSGCLDQDNTVAQIAALNGQGVKTVVVGFSSETATGDGPAVLSAMGKAGGYTLTCPNGLDSECAGGTCNLADQTCTNSYYQTSDRAALSGALARLAQSLDPFPCKHPLPLVPSDEKFISVVVDGVAVPRGDDTWQFVPPQEVDLVGSLCARAEKTTSLSPMALQIGVIQTL
jgi:hypothetical protein